MGRKRSRKIPLGSSSGKPVGSARKARRLTSAFHHLSRELEAAHARGDRSSVQRIKAELEKHRREYQDASIYATSQFRTSRWVVRVLRALDAVPVGDEPRLSVLEVGAINTQLLSCPFLRTRAIDIVSRHPDIEEADFFSLPTARDTMHAIVCAMVLNCVPAPGLRGEMLRRMRDWLVPGGLLFLAIPRQCLTRSPYTDEAHFVGALRRLGMPPLLEKQTPKVSLYCCQRRATSSRAAGGAAAAPGGVEGRRPPPAACPRSPEAAGHPCLKRARRRHEAALAAMEGSITVGEQDIGAWSPAHDAERSGRGAGLLEAIFPDPPKRRSADPSLTNTFSFSFPDNLAVASLLR